MEICMMKKEVKWFPHDDATFVNPFMWNYYTEKFVREQTLMATTFAKVKLHLALAIKLIFKIVSVG